MERQTTKKKNTKRNNMQTDKILLEFFSFFGISIMASSIENDVQHAKQFM